MRARFWWRRVPLAAVSLFLVFGTGVLWSKTQQPCAVEVSRFSDRHDSPGNVTDVDLYISIGSKPSNAELRQVLRDTWLQWIPPLEARFGIKIVYRFFTETTDATKAEHRDHDDLVLTSFPRGYDHFFLRFFGAVEWPMQQGLMPRFQVKMDDDVFVCLPTLIRDLFGSAEERVCTSKMFFWGKYFCLPGKRVADENFMVFSQDLITTLVSLQHLLRVNEAATFAAHFGAWQHFLPITIFDDRGRLDNQQGPLTKYMTSGEATASEAAAFCSSYLAAHHVKSYPVFQQAYHGAPSLEAMIALSTNRPPAIAAHRSSICGGRQEEILFNPGRTSLGGGFPVMHATESYPFTSLDSSSGECV